MKFLKTLFRRKIKLRPETRDAMRWKDFNSGIDGYSLTVAPHADLPKRILERHGETAAYPLNDETQQFGGRVMWLPYSNSDLFKRLEEGSTMASPIGPIKRDGALLLPYLLKARDIIEEPVRNAEREIEEALERVENLKRLQAFDPNISDSQYFQCCFGSENRALLLVLKEMDAQIPRSLLPQHIRSGYEKGFPTVKSMLDASDQELLSIRGIGKARIQKIRDNE